MSGSLETTKSACHICGVENPPANKFCGRCGVSLDRAIGAVVEYLDTHLRTRLDAAIKDRFRDQALVEVETAARVADKVSGWAKLYGLYVGVPLIAASAYLAWLGFDVNRSLGQLQIRLAEVTKSSDDLSTTMAAAKARAATIEKSANDLQGRIANSTASLAQLPQLAASVSQLSDRVAGTGAAQLVALQQKGNAIGVDVSRFNLPVDGAKLRFAGVAFVYAKASQGTASIDASFAATCKSARQAGVLCGGYHWLMPGNPEAQAESFLKRVASVPTDLPPAVDVEPNPQGGSASLEDLKAFLAIVSQKTGCTPVVYGGRYLKSVTASANDPYLSRYALWVAQYGLAPPTVSPPWKDWTFWQFSNGLALQGLSAMDVNAFNGNETALREFAKKACPQRR